MTTDGMYHEECENCGESIDTTPGMDDYTEVTDYTTTDYESRVYCNRLCLEQSLQSKTNGDDFHE